MVERKKSRNFNCPRKKRNQLRKPIITRYPFCFTCCNEYCPNCEGCFGHGRLTND